MPRRCWTLLLGRGGASQYHCLMVVMVTNQAFMRRHSVAIAASSFPNLAPTSGAIFVVGCLRRMDLPSFKTHLRDFLVQLKEFSADLDNQDASPGAEQQQLHAGADLRPGVGEA